MKSKPSKLDAHAALIAEWFSDSQKVSLAEAVSRLSALGCKVSTGRLSEWWAAREKRSCIDAALASVAAGAQMGREIDAAFARNPAPELRLLISLLKNVVLNLTLKGVTDRDALEMAGELTKRILEFAKLQSAESIEAAKRELQSRAEDRQRDELKVKQRLATVAEMKIGELLLKAAQDSRAKEIASLDCSKAEKIELLRKHYFADVDALEASGNLVLPPA